MGAWTKSCITKKLEEGDITQQVLKFYASVRAFYETALEYALNNLPVKDELLKNAGFLNFISRENSNFNQVEYFVDRYNSKYLQVQWLATI